MNVLLSRLAFALAVSIPAAPSAAQGFLHRPIKGVKKVLFYPLTYPAGPGSPAAGPLPLTTPCEGTVGRARFGEIIEETLENNAYGRMNIQFDWAGTGDASVLMPLPLADYDTGCDDNMLVVLRDARAAAFDQFGLDWNDYDYEVLLTAKFWNNGPQGGGGFNKNFRASFCGPNGLPLSDLVLHEMGHGFKFEHASYWAASPLAATGCLEQYGDKFDIMGQVDNPQQNCERHFHIRHKIWAKWTPVIPLQVGTDPLDVIYPTVTSDGTYWIRRVEDGKKLDPTPRGLRIPQDPFFTFYVTYRGDDPAADLQCAPGEAPCNGALITRARDRNLRPSGNTQLLNQNFAAAFNCGGSPGNCAGSSNWCSSVLTQGETFEHPTFHGDGNGLRIEVLTVLPNRIRVRVTFTGSPVTIDPLPAIDILNPLPGDLLTGMVPIQVTAWDPDDATGHFDGVSKIVVRPPSGGPVTFLPPGNQAAGYETFTYDTSLDVDGPRVFLVEAHDEANGLVQRIRFRYLSDNGNSCP